MSGVALLIGSLRQGSLTRKLAHALVAVAAPVLRLEVAPIGHLTFYHPVLDASPLPEWAAFRATIQAADAVLFVTPESPARVPGVLRNAIDIGARAEGCNAWRGKPGGVVRVGPGPQLAAAPGPGLQASLEALSVPTMALPEGCQAGAGVLFDDQGQLADAATREYLARFVVVFSAWIELHRQQAARSPRS